MEGTRSQALFRARLELARDDIRILETYILAPRVRSLLSAADSVVHRLNERRADNEDRPTDLDFARLAAVERRLQFVRHAIPFPPVAPRVFSD